jgi:hypothetical protein
MNGRNQLFLILAASLIMAFTQEAIIAQGHQSIQHENSFMHHRVALMIAHTHVPGARTGTQGSVVIVPSWGLNYEYWLNHQWAVGIHSDMEIATYIIESHESTEIERERSIIIGTVGIFKPVHQIALIPSVGREIETHENLWVVRFGIDYEFDLRDDWDLSPSLTYDIKESLYDSWTLGLSVG